MQWKTFLSGKGIFDPLIMISVAFYLTIVVSTTRPLKRTAVRDQEGISSFIFPRIRDTNESGDHDDLKT